MARYSSYASAQKRGGQDVWPGCGTLGRCMPCGRLHNYMYRSHVHGSMVDDFRCSRNYRSGCPHPKPQPEHNLNTHGRCRRCGQQGRPLEYKTVGTVLVRRDGLLSWRCPECGATGTSKQTRRTCPECCRAGG